MSAPDRRGMLDRDEARLSIPPAMCAAGRAPAPASTGRTPGQ